MMGIQPDMEGSAKQLKLLIVCNHMHIGGVQKSLVNLLKEIAPKHDVTLFLFYPTGDFLKDVPENIKIKSGNFFTRILGMSQAEAKMAGIASFLWRSFWVIITRILGIPVSYGCISKMQRLPDEYDVAISFMQNSAYRVFYGGFNEFVINSVKAKKKISFVHCDFKNYFGNNAYNRKYYNSFDRIACVSDSVKAVFNSVCPDCADKTYSVHNCYDFEEMQLKSEKYTAQYTIGKINLFSASRISEEKGILRMMPILARLKENGTKFVWRIAGNGALLDRATEERNKYGLKDDVVFLGMLDNPYPYFKASDMLLVPSYDEAAPMVYGEAAYFGLPVFTTEVTSAREMIEKTGAGFVCKNDDNDIEKNLYNILITPELITEKRKNTLMNNDMAITEFEAVIS